MTQDLPLNYKLPEEPDVPANTPLQRKSEERYERGTDLDVFSTHEQDVDEKHANKDMANNDGTIAETLDNVFHDASPFLQGNDSEGSKRPDYYETNPVRESDAEEEIEAVRKEKEPKE